MIRKILITVVIILLSVLTYQVFANGIHISSLNIFGIKEIRTTNDEIDTKIEEATKLTDTDFPTAQKNLQNSLTKLTTTKEDYIQLTSVSTEAQIIQASELEEYEIEFLWARVGSLATREGVAIKMEVKSSDNVRKSSDGRKLYDLYFTAEGSYIGTALFISALENDSDLKFKIENFSMVKEGSKEQTKNANNLITKFRVNIISISNIDKVQNGQGGQTGTLENPLNSTNPISPAKPATNNTTTNIQ